MRNDESGTGRPKQRRSETASFAIGLVLTFLVGATLRWYLLPDQILLDDEWHGINFVIDKTLKETLTGFNPVDNSSPLLNVYRWVLYRTWGWSETALRLPALLAGLLSLLLFPMAMRKWLGDRTSLIFAGLLSISPFLIFYSRYSRAYSLMLLLGFGGVLFLYGWLTTARNHHALGYLLTGCVAVYAHPLSVIPVCAPLGVAVAFGVARSVLPSFPRGLRPIPSGRALTVLSVILAPLISVSLLPVLMRSSDLPWATGHFTQGTALTVVNLLGGATSVTLNLLMVGLSMLGVARLLRRLPLLAMLFLSVCGAYSLALAIVRPNLMEFGIVILRYAIVTVPMVLLTAALAIDSLVSVAVRHLPSRLVARWLPPMLVGILVALLVLEGPLPETYHAPNNFTNHSAFQGFYAPHSWSLSDARHIYPAYTVKSDQIPAFYNWLRNRPEAHAIIEYPFDVCNFNNLLYYYQHFHRKWVLAGYSSRADLLGATCNRDELATMKGPFAIATLVADQILSRVPDPHRLRLRNMVDLENMQAVRDSRAEYVVLHKSLRVLCRTSGSSESRLVGLRHKSVSHYTSRFRETFGHAVFEDNEIVVFEIIDTSTLAQVAGLSVARSQ